MKGAREEVVRSESPMADNWVERVRHVSLYFGDTLAGLLWNSVLSSDIDLAVSFLTLHLLYAIR